MVGTTYRWPAPARQASDGIVSCEPGGEAFAVTVTSPRQLDRELQDGARIEYGRGYMFMRDYDEQAIASALQKLLDGCRDADWAALQSVVTRYFDWIS